MQNLVIIFILQIFMNEKIEKYIEFGCARQKFNNKTFSGEYIFNLKDMIGLSNYK